VGLTLCSAKYVKMSRRNLVPPFPTLKIIAEFTTVRISHLTKYITNQEESDKILLLNYCSVWEHPHKCKTALSAQYSGSQSPHHCNKLFTPANHRRAAQRRPGKKGGISSQKKNCVVRVGVGVCYWQWSGALRKE
jgi:hypothetical protein